MEKPTPRIDGSMFNAFRNRAVRLIGRVEQVKQNNIVTIYTPSMDNPSTERYDVQFSAEIQVEQGQWYDIIARVADDMLVRAIDVSSYGGNINEKALAGLIKYTHKTPELFYASDDW